MIDMNEPRRPKNVRLRLVYDVTKTGKPISYICLEKSQSVRILKIADYINNNDKDVTIEDLVKNLKMKQSTLHVTVQLLAGVVRVDMKSEVDGPYEPLLGRPITVKKELQNNKVNLPKTPKYLRAPYSLSRPTI